MRDHSGRGSGRADRSSGSTLAGKPDRTKANFEGEPDRAKKHRANKRGARWHLRTKLVIATLLLLATVCITVGAATLGAVNLFATGQVDDRLTEASERAVNFAVPPPDAGAPNSSDAANPNPSNPTGPRPDPLQARGQAAGTLNALIVGGTVNTSGILDASGVRRELSTDDVATLAQLPVSGDPTDRHLSVGDYRLIAQQSHGAVVVTGLPLSERNKLLSDLAVTFVLVSLGGLLVTGVVSVVIIARSLRPLEEVSAVATQVAQLPLDAGEVRLAQRVRPPLADSRTEVGSVGHALNQMLDNVESALDARQRSEAQVRQFVADASHELRTPLASIRGYTDLLRLRERLSADGDQALSRVEAQSVRMTSLVEDLLLLARLDDGAGLRREPIDLGELALEAVDDARVVGTGHRWSVDIPDEPVVVAGDARRLQQVVTNLLANARKHTATGTTVTTSLAVSADQRHAVLAVTDDGSGIDPEFIGEIFDRFTRADSARSGTEGTTGLGLSIVRAIVVAHGGTVDVSSRPGRTEFAVRLPLAPRIHPLEQTDATT